LMLSASLSVARKVVGVAAAPKLIQLLELVQSVEVQDVAAAASRALVVVAQL